MEEDEDIYRAWAVGAGAGAGSAQPVMHCALDALMDSKNSQFRDALLFFLVFPFGDGKGHDHTWTAISADDALETVLAHFKKSASKHPEIADRIASLSSIQSAARDLLLACTTEGPTRREFITLLSRIHAGLGSQVFPPGVTYAGVSGPPLEAGDSDYVQFQSIPEDGGDYDESTKASIQSHVNRLVGADRSLATAIDSLTGRSYESWLDAASREGLLVNLRTSGTNSDPGSVVPERTASSKRGFGGRVVTETGGVIQLLWPLGIPLAWKTEMSMEQTGSTYTTHKRLWLPGNATPSPSITVDLVGGTGVQINTIRAVQSAWDRIREKFSAGGTIVSPEGYRFRVDTKGTDVAIHYEDVLTISWTRGIEDGYSVHPVLILLPLLKAHGDQGIAQSIVPSLTSSVTYALQTYQSVGDPNPTVGPAPPMTPTVVTFDVMSSLIARACGNLLVGLNPSGVVTFGRPGGRHDDAVEPTPEERRTRIRDLVEGCGLTSRLTDVRMDVVSSDRRRRVAGSLRSLNELAITLDTFRTIRKRENGLLQLQEHLLTFKPNGKTRLDEHIEFITGLARNLTKTLDSLEGTGERPSKQARIEGSGSSEEDESLRFVRETKKVYTDYLAVLTRLRETLADGFLDADPIPEDLKRDVKTTRKEAKAYILEVPDESRTLLTEVGQSLVDDVVNFVFSPPPPPLSNNPLHQVLDTAFQRTTNMSLRYYATELLATNPLYTNPESFADTKERYTLARRTYTSRESLIRSLVDSDAQDAYTAARAAIPRLPNVMDIPTLETQVASFFRKDPFYYSPRTAEMLAHLVCAYLVPFGRRVIPAERPGDPPVEVDEAEALKASGLLGASELQARNKLTALEDYWTSKGVATNEDGTPVSATELPAPSDADLQSAFNAATLNRLTATLFDAGSNEEDAGLVEGPSSGFGTPPSESESGSFAIAPSLDLMSGLLSFSSPPRSEGAGAGAGAGSGASLFSPSGSVSSRQGPGLFSPAGRGARDLAALKASIRTLQGRGGSSDESEGESSLPSPPAAPRKSGKGGRRHTYRAARTSGRGVTYKRFHR